MRLLVTDLPIPPASLASLEAWSPIRSLSCELLTGKEVVAWWWRGSIFENKWSYHNAVKSETRTALFQEKWSKNKATETEHRQQHQLNSGHAVADWNPALRPEDLSARMTLEPRLQLPSVETSSCRVVNLSIDPPDWIQTATGPSETAVKYLITEDSI